MASTQALKFLEGQGVEVTLHPYDNDPQADAVGLAAAAALGLDPGLTLKTLMVEVDGKPACAVIPSDRTLSMKRVATAFGGKAAQMMDAAKAERLTGFHTGGISPFGQRKRVPVAIEAAVMAFPTVVINGGKRGMMVILAPADALTAAGATAQPLIAD